MEDVMELEVAEPKKKEKGKSYNDETHPYLRPEFWLDPVNQFWKHKPSLYKQDAYNGILDRCRAELKENLIN